MSLRIRQTLKRILIYGSLILLAFTIQTGIFPLIPVFSSAPNLLLILTFSFGFIYGSNTGMLCGLFAGLLMDLFSGGPFGFYSLILVYIGFFNGIFTKYYYDDFITLPLLLCAINELGYNFYIYIARFLVRNRLDLGYYFVNIMVPELLFSLIVTLFVYRIFLKANKKLDRMEKKRGQNVA